MPTPTPTPTPTAFVAAAKGWHKQIQETKAAFKEVSPGEKWPFIEAYMALKRGAPRVVYSGIGAVEATHLPEVGFPHPEWESFKTFSPCPFTGEEGEWITIEIPVTFAGIEFNVGDRVRLWKMPSKEWRISGTMPLYEFARK